MKDLQILAKKVVLSMPVQKEETGALHIDRKSKAESLELIPVPVRQEVESLIQEIEKRVPDDIGWFILFVETGTRFGFSYEDGIAGAFGPSIFYGKRSRLLRDLEEIDWDEYRGSSLENMDIFDALLEDAKDKPVKIPSSCEAAERRREELSAVMQKWQADKNPAAYAIAFCQEDYEVGFIVCKDREDILGKLCNMMVTGCDILAIISEGRALSFPEIEAWKREVIDGMIGISKAKAEGRFLV